MNEIHARLFTASHKKLTHFSPVLYFVSFNQLFSLLSKTNDWFLYQMGQRAEMDQTSS